MSHTFLLESGSWIIRGHWLDSNQNLIPVTGGTIITWQDANWFTTITKLVFPESERQEIIYEYKGHLPSEQLQYTYVLKHTDLGKIEGEGWISLDSIVQRYWVLGDTRRRSGFETLFCIDESTYHLISGLMTGNHLSSTMEAILERRS
jgi:hypothetical protein